MDAGIPRADRICILGALEAGIVHGSSTLRLAAIYNVLFGAFVVAFPNAWFDLAGMPRPEPVALWQCIGMIVGVYGVGYWIAARDPVRHWPIVLVGLLGKVFGPIGFLQAALAGDMPWRAGWLIVTNDLLWWPAFVLLLLRARRAHTVETAPSNRTGLVDGPDGGSGDLRPSGRGVGPSSG